MTTNLKHISLLPTIIHQLGSQSDIMSIINLNIIVLTLKAIWNAHVQKMRLVHELPLDKLEKQITKILTTEYKKLLIQEIHALFGNQRTIIINNRYKDQRHKTSEKDKIVLP